MLSIVIPILGMRPDRAAAFRLALECTKRQTFRDFELIVVEQYVEEQPLWKGEVTPLCDQYIAITEDTLPEWGRFSLSWCKNVGARAAKYDIVVILDGDMVYGDDYYQRIVDAFDPTTGYLMGYNWISWLTPRGVQAYESDGYKLKWEKDQTHKTTVSGWTGNGGGGGSIIFDKYYLFDVIGGYSENYYGWGKEDKDLLFRAHRMLAMTGDKVFQLPYTLLHLFHKRIGGFSHKPPEADIHYFQYTRRFPHQVCYLLVEAQVGKQEGVSMIDLSRLDVPGASYLDLLRPSPSTEERAILMKKRNKKYSFQDFTNEKFFETDDLDGSVIIGSCFYQDVEGREGDPRTEIFPSNMVGVTFIECNLDNVYIPQGNTIDSTCSSRRVKRMYDGRLWILNAVLTPVEPLHKIRLRQIGANINPKKLSKIPLYSSKLLQRRRQQVVEARALNIW